MDCFGTCVIALSVWNLAFTDHQTCDFIRQPPYYLALIPIFLNFSGAGVQIILSAYGMGYQMSPSLYFIKKYFNLIN